MEQFIVPGLPLVRQAHMQYCFALCTKPEGQLTRAKQAVEVAIGKGEAAGLALLHAL